MKTQISRPISRNSATLSAAQGDLYAEIHQSTCDKLLNSVNYPFTAFERRQDFPGCDSLALAEGGALHRYTKQEIRKMLNDAVDSPDRTSINDHVYAFAGSIIEQAKKVLDAANAPSGEYIGPDKREM